jgi:hypothetical protein
MEELLELLRTEGGGEGWEEGGVLMPKPVVIVVQFGVMLPELSDLIAGTPVVEAFNLFMPLRSGVVGRW